MFFKFTAGAAAREFTDDLPLRAKATPSCCAGKCKIEAPLGGFVKRRRREFDFVQIEGERKIDSLLAKVTR